MSSPLRRAPLLIGPLTGRSRKAPIGRATDKQEETMKRVTRFEAASKPTSELKGLHRRAFTFFAHAERGPIKRSNALATMHNIDAELAQHTPYP